MIERLLFGTKEANQYIVKSHGDAIDAGDWIQDAYDLLMKLSDYSGLPKETLCKIDELIEQCRRIED